MYERAKLNTKIKMIEVTTAPVVALPTPAAPPRVCKPWYEPISAMITPNTADLNSPLSTSSNGSAEPADVMNDSCEMCAYAPATSIPPMIEMMSARIVSSGSMMMSASKRGTTSMRVGDSPSDCRASICSVTTIEPSSAAMAAPVRPATTTAESIGPSSRAVVNATTPPTRLPTPNCTAWTALSSENTMPVNSDVRMTIETDCTPSRYDWSSVSRTRMRSAAMKRRQSASRSATPPA